MDAADFLDDVFHLLLFHKIRILYICKCGGLQEIMSSKSLVTVPVPFLCSFF